MVERGPGQLSFEVYRMKEIDRMFCQLGIPQDKVVNYRNGMISLLSDNTRVNGTARERLYDYLRFKLRLREQLAPPPRQPRRRGLR
jgi:hypothetical protein